MSSASDRARFCYAVKPSRGGVREANTVLNGRPARYHEPGFDTTLSLKSVVAGQAHYRTCRTEYRGSRSTSLPRDPVARIFDARWTGDPYR